MSNKRTTGSDEVVIIIGDAIGDGDAVIINEFHLDGADHGFGLGRVTWAGTFQYTAAKEGPGGFVNGFTDFGFGGTLVDKSG